MFSDSVMNLPELLRAINTVAQTGATPARCEWLAREVHRLADMVGWATGFIDANGQLLNRLAALQSDLDVRYAQTRDMSIATLHDSLSVLGRAIASHDEDLDPGCTAEDEGEDV